MLRNATQPFYLYFSDYVKQTGMLSHDVLHQLYERHKVQLDPKQNIDLQLIKQDGVQGVVIAIDGGIPGKLHLQKAKKFLRKNLRVWFYWPQENVVEHIDKEYLKSYWRHWLFLKSIPIWKKTRGTLTNLTKLTTLFFQPTIHKINNIFSKIKEKNSILIKKMASFNDKYILPIINFIVTAIKKSYRVGIKIKKTFIKAPINLFYHPNQPKLEEFLRIASPISFPKDLPNSTPQYNSAAYLRLDFWAKIKAGGSYGHTCYLAKELKKNCHKFVSFTAQPYDLLHKLAVQQITLDSIGDGNEHNIALATDYYYPRLKSAMLLLNPDFIYERICIGNYAGALLSHELKIPYIVEYNGSEIAMKRSFSNSDYQYSGFYLLAEQAAFKQATLISVVSQVVADDLIGRGVPKEKILVNPNGADPDFYSPVDEKRKQALKDKFSWRNKTVIGFIGTFGGWHGIDVLAQALPLLCQNNPEARFLLIGDGNFRHLIDEVITKNALSNQIFITGIIPQHEAIDYLQACDIYISPHSSHMINSPFFGSPTKIFEYMALGGGIIASDLMQIGHVLSPALAAETISYFTGSITNERAILCAPGNTKQFVDAVTFLIKHPDIRQKLGNNARQAFLEHYTWEKHAERLFNFITQRKNISNQVADWNKKKLILKRYNQNSHESLRTNSIPLSSNTKLKTFATEDAYKEETQNQWDNDPCGSHYVKAIEPHTLEWFLEAERYRYDEYAPWMCEVMGFKHHRNKKLLEVGAGMGTDLAQFAKYGALVTDLDLSSGHLALAQENFTLRGLQGEFHHGDAENMPFADETFDVVYSNGVIHHSPNTAKIVQEMWRILKPGGMVTIMVYAENSLHYWRNLVHDIWWQNSLYHQKSIGDILSESVEISQKGAKPLVKVYTKKRLKKLFKDFENIKIVQRQMVKAELPTKWIPLSIAGKLAGWNLILKATKPQI